MFAERGFDAAQVSEIASRAEVSLATIYGLFENKEGLYVATLREISLRFFAQVDARVSEIKDPVECLLAMTDALCRVFEAEREALRLFMHDSATMPWRVVQTAEENEDVVYGRFAEWIGEPARLAEKQGRLRVMSAENPDPLHSGLRRDGADAVGPKGSRRVTPRDRQVHPRWDRTRLRNATDSPAQGGTMKPRILRAWRLPLCAAFFLVIALFGCGSGPAELDVAERDGLAATSIHVVSALVNTEQVTLPIFGTGTIVADKTTELGPVVPGIVDTIFVTEGDVVAEGDPLFSTRLVDYQIGKDEAAHSARLAAAEATKAARDLARAERLQAQGVASQGQLDDALTAHEIASARRDVAASSLARAKQNFTDTTMGAPYSGVITKRYVDEGVRMGGLSGPGAVVQMMKIDVVEAVIQVPEIHVGKLRKGMAARVQLDGTGGVFESVVGRINPQADPSSRAIEVRIPLENVSGEIRPGLFAKAELFPKPRTAKTLVRGAVLGSGDRRYVYQAVDGSARRQFVRVRELDALRVEILEGLDASARVLSGPNLPSVTEGAPVTVEVARANH